MDEKNRLENTHLTQIARGVDQNELEGFCSENTDIENFYLDEIDNQDWQMPDEGISTRHDLEMGSNSLEEGCLHSNPVVNESEEMISHQIIDRGLLNVPDFTNSLTTWDFSDYVRSTMEYFVEQGDIQTAVCIMLVVGDEVQVEKVTKYNWLMSYIDLLSQMKLFIEATRVMRASSLEDVSTLNCTSTTYLSTCARCGKNITKTGWFCVKCPKVVTCVVCHQPVKGLFAWCQGCAHGGHISHMQEWFSSRRQCPAGCGHLCEYI